MLKLRPTSRFKKDLRTVKKQPKNKKGQILLEQAIILQLQKELVLENKHSDHELINQNPRKRECHILPDLLLIYRINSPNLILYRLGSHSDLF